MNIADLLERNALRFGPLPVEALPRIHNGKIDKQKLRAMAQESQDWRVS